MASQTLAAAKAHLQTPAQANLPYTMSVLNAFHDGCPPRRFFHNILLLLGYTMFRFRSRAKAVVYMDLSAGQTRIYLIY